MATSICSDPARSPTQSNRRNDVKLEVGLVNLDILEVLLQHAQILPWEYLLFDWHYCTSHILSFFDRASVDELD